MSDLPDHPGPACPCAPCVEAYPERAECPVIECALWTGHSGAHKSINALATEWLYPQERS